MKPDLSTYGGLQHEIGYAGQVAKQGPLNVISRTNAPAVARDIEFGRAVARGPVANSCQAPIADGNAIIGISVRHPVMVADAAGEINYGDRESVPVMTLGYVYAVATEAATAGDAVLSLTAGFGTLGSTTGGAAGAGRIVVPGAKWETTTGAGQIGLIRIVS